MTGSERRVEVDGRELVLDDFFQVEAARLRYELFGGGMSDTVRRLNFERRDAAAVLLVERESGDVILIEQFRFPTYAKGPGWLVEAVAGIVADGEDPAETARREALEETGYRVGELDHIGTFYLSPGGSSERIFMYHAEVAAADRVAAGGGLAAEGEDIRIVRLPTADVADALTSARFADAKTVVGLMWLEGRRTRE